MRTFAGKRRQLPSITIVVCTLVILASACGPATATTTPTWVYSTPTPGKTLCVDLDIHSNCYSSVTDALNHAGEGDIIEVHAGEYTDNIDIHANIALRGAWPDGLAATTIRGASYSDKPVIKVEYGYHVNIQNLHITGGNTAGGLESHGFVDLYNMHIDHNSTLYYGGGINASGGGPYHAYGSLDIRHCSITDNSANDGSSYNQGGGGINAVRTDLTLTDTVVSGNSAKSGGGGLFVLGRTLVIKSSTISGNNTGGSGGGMYVSANLQMSDSTISQNTAIGDGGGIFFTPFIDNYFHVPATTDFFVGTIERVTIDHNRTDGNGGGVENLGNDLTLTNLTVSANTAVARGGGIYNSSYRDIYGNPSPTAGAIMHIYSTTIANNVSPNQGGGIADDVNPAAPNQLYIATSILSNNFGANCRLNSGTGFQSWDYNLSSDSTCNLPYHADKINTAAMLNPLAGTGALKTHSLKPGSPAVHMVDVCSGTDERGVPRGTPLCDAGSYEGTQQPFHPQQMIAVAVMDADCLAGPGTDYETLGILKAGDPHSISGRNSDGTWLKLDTCWVPTGKLWTNDDPQTAPVLEVAALPTALPTSGPLTCTPNINAYCRLGPGQVFDALQDLAMSGQAYPLDGQNLAMTWYRIMLTPNEGCWVQADVCLPSGDTSGLRVLNEVPIPTGVPSCSTYTDQTTCTSHGSLCQWKFTTSGPGQCVNK